MDIRLLKRIPWVKVYERDLDIALDSFYFSGLAPKYYKGAGVDFFMKNRIALDNGKIFFDERELEFAHAYFLKAEPKVTKCASGITERFLGSARQYERFLRRMKKQPPPADRSGAVLKRVFGAYLDALLPLIPYSFVVSHVLEEAARRLITPYLRMRHKNPETVYAELVVSARLNRTTEEYLSRLTLAAKVASPKIFSAAQKHVRRYGPLISSYRPTDPLMTTQSLLADVREIARHQDVQKEREKFFRQRQRSLRNAERIFHAIKAPPYIRSLIRIMRKNAWIRTWRREIINEGLFVMRPVYEAVAERMRIPFSDLAYIACWEIMHFLRSGKRVRAEEIARRKRGFAIVNLAGKSGILSGTSLTSLRFLKDQKMTQKNLVGTPVYPGLVKGSVQVIAKKWTFRNSSAARFS